MSNQAKWSTEAGGYVQNGSIVSTTPIYNADGTQQVDVDVSQLTPQASSQNLQNVSINPDATIATAGAQINQAGSGEDVNEMETKAGALASLNLNSENSDYGVLNTPATHSNVAGEPVLSPVDQTLKDIAYHQAHNNLQGMINGYTTLQQQTGQDYTPQITQLTEQRNQKIAQQDDAYSQAYSNAMTMGDYTTAAQIQQQQAAYRNSVDFQEARQSQFELKQQELDLDFEDAYISGLNDIYNGVISQLSGLLNFQYDPNTDRALHVAQGYAVGKVKEQMNHTGMYYSSMTQGAITRAVAELVPVYEKMARDEIKENISMLMNVGNYLMNLEKTQFDLWRDQIQLKWDANNEKRKEYQAALDRANAWGFVSNDDAAILNVAPGTLSPDAIKEVRQLQQEIDKEQRTLQNQMALEKYKTELDIQYAQQNAMIKAAYSTSSSSSGRSYGGKTASGSLTMDQLTKTLTPIIKAGASDEEVTEMALALGKDVSAALGAITVARENVKSDAEKISKDRDEKVSKLNNVSDFLKDTFGGSNKGYELIKKYNDYLGNRSGDADTKSFVEGLGNATESDRVVILDDLYKKDVLSAIDSQAAKFSNKSDVTSKAIESAMDKIDSYASNLGEYADEYTQKGYEYLVDKIKGADEVDTSWWDWFGSTDKDKKNAIQEVLDHIGKDKLELYTNIKGYAG